MLESSNMTHEEFFRVNGTLSTDRIDAVLCELDSSQALDVRQYAPYAQEARGCYIEEDFLQSSVLRLQRLAKSLRGDNRQELLSIIETMEGDISQAIASAEYGADELNKIIRTIKR